VVVSLIALTYLELSHVAVSARLPALGRASELAAGQSTSWDVFLLASLRVARLVINADLSNNS
jgi:hypothetical protein